MAMNYYGSVPEPRTEVTFDPRKKSSSWSAKLGLLGLGFTAVLMLFAVAVNNPVAPESPVVLVHTPAEPTPAAVVTTVTSKHSSNKKHDSQTNKNNRTTTSWCFDCEQRCDNVRQAMVANNAGISGESRTAKFQHLASDIGVFYRGTDHLFLEDYLTGVTEESVQGQSRFTTDKTKCFIDADQHINNFGTFQDSNGMFFV